MLLNEAVVNKIYTIEKIENNDLDMKNFLTSLGCFNGEKIVLVSKQSSNFIINVKNTRYGINKNIAQSIFIK